MVVDDVINPATYFVIPAAAESRNSAKASIILDSRLRGNDRKVIKRGSV
jgi:hypothetical protein